MVNVPSNAPDGSALHGQVYLVPWQERTPGFFVTRGGGAGTGWPWPYETTLQVSVGDAGAGLAITFAQVLTNLGGQPMPGGIGFHPWFRAPLDVSIVAERILPDNLRGDDPAEAVSGAFDLRKMRPMPSGLDATWLDLDEPAVHLRWPDLAIKATLEVTSDAGLCIVAASPADGGAVAVEPETHAPQGLRRMLTGAPHGLAWLGPGEAIHLTTRITFERSS
jgi:aldose 1-epimerase